MLTGPRRFEIPAPVAMLIPVIAFGLQWALWPYVQPYVWFLFYPAVFFASWIGGTRWGMAATLLSAFLVWWGFMPPMCAFKTSSGASLSSVVIFMGMGLLFSLFQEKLRKARHQAEQGLVKLQELDELKSRLFANVSHELRTPLTLILGPTERLLDRPLDPALRRDLEIVDRNARLLYRHVTDLLDVSRLESGRMPVQIGPMDLALTARTMASHFESLAQDRHIQFHCEVPDRLVMEGDAPKIQRVILNLLSNAFKFTPEGGNIRLRVLEVDSRALIQVHDSGPGIPTTAAEKVFERFSQVEDGSERTHGGTGLGLAIVKEFALLHHGKAMVHAAPDGGSIFEVILPIQSAVKPTGSPQPAVLDKTLSLQMVEELKSRKPFVPPPQETLPQESRQSPLVLVVEDNPDLNTYLWELLQDHYRVERARDGQEGLEKALALHPDLILTDAMMPRMGGDRMIQAIRASTELTGIPIVVLTAKVDEAFTVRLLQHGAQDCIHKPFSDSELLSRIHAVLSQSQRSRQAVARSEIRYQGIFENMTAGFAHCRMLFEDDKPVDFIYLDVNPAFRQLTGLGEVIGRKVSELIPGIRESNPELFDIYGRVAKTGQAERLVTNVEGLGIWFMVQAYQPAPGEFIAIFDNITEQKKAELALQEATQRLELATRSSGLGIWDWNLQTNQLIWDDRMFEIFGYTRANNINGFEAWMSRLHPDDLKLAMEGYDRARQGQGNIHMEFRLLMPGDQIRYIVADAFAVRDKNGRALRLVGSNRDVTEQKEAEQQRHRIELEMLQAQKMESIGLLASGVAHDMNNVLAAILGISTLLQAKYATEPSLIKSLGTIEHAAIRGRELVKALTDFVRKDLEAPHLLDLNALVNKETEILRQTTRQKVALEVDLEPGLGWIMGESGTLGSALMNLCVNAVDAMPEGGTLRLKTRAVSPDRVALIVEDTGQGMNPETLARATEPFFTTKPIGKGTGLGLAMVHSTAKAHGGSLEIQSEVGQGTVITLSFPVVAPPPAIAEPEAIPEPHLRKALRILLVDDDELIQSAVPSQLIQLGHRVEMAIDGPSALEAFEAKGPFDLIILDHNMPGMTGVQVLDRIKGLHPEQAIMMATGFRDTDLEAGLTRWPGTSILNKPFSQHELRDALEAY